MSAPAKGMAAIAAPHELSAAAGAEVLERGGNAIEAVVAAGAALSVLYPHFCGLGGDAIWLVSDAEGAVDCYLGIGQAPADISSVTQIALRGPGSMLTTAALVDSWDRVIDHSAVRWGGRESLSSLLDRAIALAEDGFPVSRSQTFWADFRAKEAADWPGFAQTFVARGRQRQPALARSLRRLADAGARDFYEGALARDIARDLAAVGAPLTGADLAATRTELAAPLSLDYRGHRLFAPPPPTQGLTTLEIMGCLRAFPMADFPPDGPDFYHHLVEAVKQAFLDRPAIADPRFAEVPVQRLLGDAHLARAAARIRPDRALDWPQPFRRGDTAFLGAIDAEGRAVSMLQSIYFDWGSGVVLPETGLLWQNRGAAFSLDPDSPNRLAPGKRPFYTLNPGLAQTGGRTEIVYGTQGADGQPQTLSLLLSLLIDHGLSPEAALARPRFLLGKTFSDSRDSLKLEAGLPGETLDMLTARGHVLSPIEALSQLGGQAGVLRRGADGALAAAHDPRSDGCALFVAAKRTADDI